MEVAFLLQKTFGVYFEAPIAIWEHFASYCEIVHYKKEEIIKETNKQEKYGYFLLNGSAGIFLWKENYEVCLELIMAPNFFGDEISLNTNKPSPLICRAIEPITALRISKQNLIFLKQTPIGMQLFLIAAEQSLVIRQQHQIDLLIKTAQQRYTQLLTTQPELIARIPQKYIASYLGITTQSLSRIRRSIK